MINSGEEPPGRRESVGDRLTTTAYPSLLLLAATLLLVEFFYRPNGIPSFIAAGDGIAGPGFWSTRLVMPLGLLLVLNIIVAYRRRSGVAGSRARWAAILLSLASAGVVLLLACIVVLGPFQPRVVAIGDPSEAGCRIYASRQDVLDGAGGEFLVRRTGEVALVETGERWSARGGPAFSVDQYVDVSWNGEGASVRDISGDDPNSFYFRDSGEFSC